MTNDAFNFDTSLIFALVNGNVSTAIQRKLSQNFKSSGIALTPDQWFVMLVLSIKDSRTQNDLCTATYKDKAGMTRLLDSMERQELILRVPSKEDKRVKYIKLTRLGREIAEKAQFIANRTLKAALRGLSMEEIKVCQEAMRIIFSNATD
ncbi:MAG: MarR family transcriptional regulator [Bacteroidaceae bacterium]|nr:MarR family transcriptional regulator [Candidatus Minthousia equi]MCQ2246902.1 MarR family transcriptional regulator [Bacteroidaceae bacterium]MDO4955504.1 MarR family transcriptional regulator [Bacteroidales bacterium]